MKAFATICLLGVLVAAFSVVAVITQSKAAESTRYGGEATVAPRPASEAQEASRQLLAVMRELLDGQDVACERILRTLLGLEEGEEIDNEQLVRLLLGIEDSDDVDPREVLTLLEGNVSLE